MSSEWVRSVHVSSEWVRCTCIQWVSEVYMCPVSEWVSEVYMCSVSEWGVHVSTEWVRCTCVQWVSDLKRTEWLAYLNKWNKGKIDGMIDWWTGYTHQLTDRLSNWLIECLTDWDEWDCKPLIEQITKRNKWSLNEWISKWIDK